jgi:hypothetical protein
MWDRVKHWQFVRQNQAVPSVEAFQRWFSEKLRTPQGCLALSSIAGPVGGVIFSELQAIVDREVNPSLPDDGRVDSFSVVDEETAVPLTTWAVERDHDALLAWLIFVCAQCPIGDLDAVVRERLQRVPGPRTEHALMYYLASLEAIDEIAQKALAGRFTLHKPLPRPTLVIPSAKGSLPPQVPKETAAAPADVANAFPVAAEVLSTAVHNKPDTRYGTHAAPALETVISPMDNALGAAVGEQDLVMSIKVRLVDIIQGLLPGDPEFPQALDKVQEEIRRLEEIHRQQVEERNKAAAAWAAAQEVRSLQGRLASLLRQVLPQVGSPFDFDAKEVAPADHGRATEELHAVSAAVVEALRALELEKELRRLPVPARLEDRRRRNKDCDNLLATAEEHIAHARHLMESGVAIIVVESPDAGGVGAESAPASSQVAPTASASPAAVAPSEPATTTSEPTARPTALQNAAVVTTVPVAPSTTAAEPAGAGNEVSSTTAGTDAASTVATTTAAAAASTADTVEVELQVDSQVADDALTASPTSEVTAPATVDALAPVATPAPTSVPAPVSAAALVSPPPVKTPAIAATGAVPSARPKALQQAVAATSSTPVAKAPFDLGFAVQPPPLIAPGCQSADLPVAWRNPVDRCQADHRADDG